MAVTYETASCRCHCHLVPKFCIVKDADPLSAIRECVFVQACILGVCVCAGLYFGSINCTGNVRPVTYSYGTEED
jgi:hypothetical protein